MSKGFLITIEGPDGSGKSTQIELLKKYLETKGYTVTMSREPGGTPISEKIREIILDKNNSEMVPMTEALLYAASRAQHVAEVIKPAIEKGNIVICDRFVDSSIAYQGYGRKLGEPVTIINGYAIDGCVPDLTILFKLDPSVSMGRIKRDQDRLENEKMQFHQAVFEGYLEIEKKFPDRVFGVDAGRSIEEIHMDICARVAKFLK